MEMNRREFIAESGAVVALAALPTNDAFGVDGSANVTKQTNKGKENDRCENYS